MADPLQDPKDELDSKAGYNSYGKDFGPSDRHFAHSRTKLRGVIQGRDSLKYDELQRLLARVILGR